MLVNEILNTDIRPIAVTDTVALALTKMDLIATTKFPVVNKDKLLIGMAELDTLIEVDHEEMDIRDIELGDPIYIRNGNHIFEASRLMLTHELFALPVVDSDMKFLGMVRKREVLKALGEIFNLSVYGSVITVGVEHFDFSLSELARIVEEEGAKILGVAVQQPNSDNNTYQISLKLNIEDSSKVSAALRRFGYLITSEANSETMDTDYSERANELLRYLDI